MLISVVFKHFCWQTIKTPDDLANSQIYNLLLAGIMDFVRRGILYGEFY